MSLLGRGLWGGRGGGGAARANRHLANALLLESDDFRFPGLASLLILANVFRKQTSPGAVEKCLDRLVTTGHGNGWWKVVADDCEDGFEGKVSFR